MFYLMLIFIIIDVVQTFYIRYLQKEISARDKRYADEPIEKKQSKILKRIRQLFGI